MYCLVLAAASLLLPATVYLCGCSTHAPAQPWLGVVILFQGQSNICPEFHIGLRWPGIRSVLSKHWLEPVLHRGCAVKCACSPSRDRSNRFRRIVRTFDASHTLAFSLPTSLVCGRADDPERAGDPETRLSPGRPSERAAAPRICSSNMSYNLHVDRTGSRQRWSQQQHISAGEDGRGAMQMPILVASNLASFGLPALGRTLSKLFQSRFRAASNMCGRGFDDVSRSGEREICLHQLEC